MMMMIDENEDVVYDDHDNDDIDDNDNNDDDDDDDYDKYDNRPYRHRMQIVQFAIHRVLFLYAEV